MVDFCCFYAIIYLGYTDSSSAVPTKKPCILRHRLCLSTDMRGFIFDFFKNF